jgi:uncharacterized membrane protein YedE/YeeE
MTDAAIVQNLQLAMLALGVAFGVVAERTAFCFRSAILEVADAARPASAGQAAPFDKATAWIVALAVAALATQALVFAGVLDLAGTPYLQAAPPLLSIAIGGALFGVGMIWCGGCISRLLVLAASGNLRSVVSLLVLAAVAYASIRGVIAPGRAWLENAGRIDFAAIGGPTWAQALGTATGVAPATVGVALAGVAAALVLGWLLRSGALVRRIGAVATGALIGGLVVAGWTATTLLAAEAFEPPPPQSLRFTETLADSLLYGLLATGVDLKPGVLLIVGVLAGAHLSARIGGRVKLVGFDTARATARYLCGAALMGVGGVLALGCTVGQGLTGMSTLSIGSFVALAAIAAGALLGRALLARMWERTGVAAQPATPPEGVAHRA